MSLIDEWPEKVWLSLDKIDPNNLLDNEDHHNWKKFEDGTFEMIPQFPEQEPRSIICDVYMKIRM